MVPEHNANITVFFSLVSNHKPNATIIEIKIPKKIEANGFVGVTQSYQFNQSKRSLLLFTIHNQL